VGPTTSPVNDQSFSDKEEHNSDLGDREEAPDRSLFHKIRGDESGQIGSEHKEEDALNDHPFLLVKSKKRCEHQERVDGGSWNDVGGISHWDRPGEMIIASESAKLLSSQPFGGGSDKSLLPNISKKKSCKQHSSTNQTKSFDDQVAIDVFFVFCKGSIDDVAEIRLQTDVKITQNSQDLIHNIITDGGLEIGSDEKILYRLKKLHREEEEDTGSKGCVVGP